jgi:polar amino acid transport system substrate-binding protein
MRKLAGLFAVLFVAGCAMSPSVPPAVSPEAKSELTPTGKLRVGLNYQNFLLVLGNAPDGTPRGIAPDLGRELARRLGVPAQLIRYENPVAVIEAFRKGELDATFIGITADRAAAFDFGPVVLDLQTAYLVPAASPIKSIDEIDRPDLRLLVPARSAQEAFLKKTIAKATMISVAVENPKQAVEKLAAGEADAFSHVVPMLVSAQAALPGSRILPGSYYNVPIAIGYPKGAPPAVMDFAKAFVADMKASGFAQKAIERMGQKADGVVVEP